MSAMVWTPFSALALVLLVCIGSAGNACIGLLQEHYLLRDFAIQIHDWRGIPVPAARVLLSPSIAGSNPGPEALTATTDEAGIARFRDGPVGGYSATTEMPNGEYLEVTVVDSGSMELVQPDLRLKWPNLQVIATQSASGRLASDSAHPLGLTLLKADSGEHLESIVSDPRGNFHFSEVGPGLHFIRVTSRSNSSLEGDIAIAIEPTAKNAKIDLLIGWSSCGLSYVDNVRCTPSGPLEVANLCGTVVDPSGAIIPDARIRVTSATDDPTHPGAIKKKPDGTFAVLGILPGRYTLQVSGEGFHQLQVPVRVQDGSGTSCFNPITVTLGVFSSCSKAEVKSRK